MTVARKTCAREMEPKQQFRSLGAMLWDARSRARSLPNHAQPQDFEGTQEGIVPKPACSSFSVFANARRNRPPWMAPSRSSMRLPASAASRMWLASRGRVKNSDPALPSAIGEIDSTKPEVLPYSTTSPRGRTHWMVLSSVASPTAS